LSLVISNTKNSLNFTNDQCPMTNDYLNFPNDRFYKTGDLARWLPAGPPAGGASGGVIEFLGRLDQQVKIRGYRIELEEIENCLLKHNDIKQALALVKTNENMDKFICAYITAAKQFDITALRGHLSLYLPGYMMPAQFVQVDKIPLTPGGKVDRKALDLYSRGLATGTAYEAPQNENQEKIIKIWQQVLKRDKIGIHDNYFDLGGTSFDILRINKQLKETFQIEIPVPLMFRFTTIQAIENFINKETGELQERTDKLKKGKLDKIQQFQKRRDSRKR
ncbi:MAG: non-ribosomal peptide synthetase, partial [Acidobacteria bacterium]|nr:non-ribosomal peptide synthetase [Acidobacteriota bacterium]